MTAYYDFYKNPSPKGSKRHTHYHVRVVPNGTVTTEDIIQRIHGRCTLTPGDIRAVLTSLSEVASEELEQGRRVHIEGFGYYQMTLECPEIKSPKEIRAESVHFRNVAFRPEAKLKQRLRYTLFERVPDKSHSRERTADDIDRLLSDYFQTHETMTRLDFQRLCGFTYATANRRLKELREAGKIINIADPRHPLYKVGEK